MLIGYARVSTSDQDTALQVAALKDAGCDRIFNETASGVQRDRAELSAMLRFARSGDTVVIWKLDRLARSLSQLLTTATKLDEAGIGLASLTEKIDTTTPGGRLVFHVFGALAEFERGLLRERTLAGLKSARLAGRVGGRPRRLSDEKLDLARALLQGSDASVLTVAKTLGVSDSTLYRHLPAPRSVAMEQS